MEVKPKYVLDVEKNLGLEVRPGKVWPSGQSWEVISPTGVVLFEIGSMRNERIGMVTTPNMHVLQGISYGDT